MALLSCIETETGPAPTAAVIWLHGLGADGYDFAPVVPELRLPASRSIRFIFPHAPAIPVTINGGVTMPAWYDIRELSIDRCVDEPQLLASAAAVSDLVDREIERGIDSRAIVIAGFSQGGAVACQAALCYPQPLAGLLVMSSYFATAASIRPHPANRALPIQICHGSLDPVVPEELGHQAHNILMAMGYPVAYQTYRIEHGVCAEEIADISRWLQGVLQ